MTESGFILVVEDNEANQLLARAVLELEGFEVEIADSAPEAQAAIRAHAPDLILMDLQLPGEDGLSLTRRLKADAETRDIPIVALTAHAMLGDRDVALQAGCAGYIAKPIDTRSLGPEVRRFLGAVGERRKVAN